MKLLIELEDEEKITNLKLSDAIVEHCDKNAEFGELDARTVALAIMAEMVCRNDR